MLNLGSKKKDEMHRLDPNKEALPQLSNEMQLSIMNKVKSGELSIEDALNQARRDQEMLLQQKSLSDEEQTPTQYNFSVHKHGRYRWQKRVLQFDFKTKMLCSIEKGIVKRQLPFSSVKTCDDGVGSRFSMSFKEHHDYELEATSLEDKHKMMQLVNKIIYGNIYRHTEEGNTETCQQPKESKSIREGVLLLHRGGLASFKWVKYEVKLHPGQLTLIPFRRRNPADGEVVRMSIVIHLSDGDTRVQEPQSSDTFTLVTHKNEYYFKVPATDSTNAPVSVQTERDAWVRAIHKLCSDWKRKSSCGQTFVGKQSRRHQSIVEEAEDTDTDGGFGGKNMNNIYPPVDSPNEDASSSDGEPSSAGDPPADTRRPVPTPRLTPTPTEVKKPDREPLCPVQPPTVAPPVTPKSPPPSPCTVAFTTPSIVPKSPTPESSFSSVKVPPPPPFIPIPPPLPLKSRTNSAKKQTKAFHWDKVSSEKVAKSFWIQQSSRRIEIDTSRLYEQFAVKDLGTFEVCEQSNTQQIMLNQKIAHNFNIFLKSFPVRPGELKDKLFIVNEEDGGLSDEHITSLRRFVPTIDDVEMFKSHKGPVTELHIVDQYMLEMCNIPFLSTQLDLLLTLRELPISMNDLQPLINQKIRMCTQLCNSRSFVSVLEYLLAIGNYLNENAGKEKAKGFRLSSLPKISQLRGRDKKFTLLHALVEQIMLHEPCLATFTHELAEFETDPGASIKGLTAEVDVLKNQLKKLIQYRKISKKRKAAEIDPNFSKDLKMAIDEYTTQLSVLTKTCEEMKKLYSVILVKFGEPVDQDSQELFGLICQFIHDFKRTHAEMTNQQ